MSSTPPWGNTPDPGPYGHIKIAEILYALPAEECEEYEQLMDISVRTPEQQARVDELWALAKQLYAATGGS